jgi:iron complex transport system ATP-binding protein
MEMKPSSICCVIGENGSGKSTLLKVLSGFYKNYQGKITVVSDDLKLLNVQQLYGLRAVLTQHNLLQNHILCRDYIDLSSMGVQGADSQRQQLLTHIAQELNIVHLLDKDYLLCSGGEQQRVSLARVFLQALLHLSPRENLAKPYYLFLDEPFNALDVKHVPVLKKYLQKLKHQGFSILVVMHDINLAYELCDQTLFLKQGHSIACGPKELVFTPKNLNLTFDLAFEETHATSGKRYFSPQDLH